MVKWLASLAALASVSHAPDIIVSANDGKFVRVDGRATYPRPAPPDSLAVIDAGSFPPIIKRVVDGVDHSLAGPPQAVAVTPDGKTAFVAAPSRFDDKTGREVFETILQVVDIGEKPTVPVRRIELGAHPNGLAMNRAGNLLLAATLDGSLKVLTVRDGEARLVDSIKVGARRLSGVSFTPDGKAALVALRDEGGVAVLSVDGQKVVLTGERIATGIAPYAVDAAGGWAVVGNVGLAGLEGGVSTADADTVTLIDISRRPFRAVQHLTVPALPEGTAMSPNGRWLVVQSMAGSNLAPGTPGRRDRGRLVLFGLDRRGAHRINEVPSGQAAQGVVVAADNRTVLVQFNVEKALAVYRIRAKGIADTGVRLKLDAGPASIRSAPH